VTFPHERKQRVHFGHLANGQPGLFTGNTLAIHLDRETEDNENAARAAADRNGFEFEEKTYQWQLTREKLDKIIELLGEAAVGLDDFVAQEVHDEAVTLRDGTNRT
jgi:hypothetical protein